MTHIQREEYEILSINFKENYTTSQLLDLCEKYKLSIYGNREILIDRLAFYFSEGQYQNSISYKINQCCNQLIKICNHTHGYSEI